MSLFQGLSEFIDPRCLPFTDKTAPKTAPKNFLKIFPYSIDCNIVSAIMKIRKAKEDRAMKTIKSGNIVIEKEMTDNRWYDLVRGYKVNEKNEPVAFLGKYKVPSNYTNEELIELFTK